MSESLVAIRTFGNLLEADEAQAELLAAGIYSLLFADDQASLYPGRRGATGIVLAVHQRDADIAEAVLAPRPRPI
jgi:hypothetical protein